MGVYKSDKETKDGRKWFFRTRYTDLTGEVKHYSSGKYKTRQKACEEERAFLLSLTDKIDYNEMTMQDLYAKYLEYQQDIVKQTTLHSYHKRWEYLQEFGKVKVATLNSSHYELFRKMLLKKNISDDYRNDIQKFLKILLNFAMKMYSLNLTEFYKKIRGFKNPNAPMKEEMAFYTFEEYSRFRAVEEELLYKCAFDLLYYCGLRRGELLGLSWKNVDLERREIRIRDNVVRDCANGRYLITTPKTKSSIRTVPLTQALADELRLLKEESQKKFGFKNSWFVLGYEEPIPFGRLRDRKRKNSAKARLKEIRLHDFRHSCASLLISKGANITLVAKYLGHTKIDETLNTYSHFFKSDLNSLVESLDQIQQETNSSC